MPIETTRKLFRDSSWSRSGQIGRSSLRLWRPSDPGAIEAVDDPRQSLGRGATPLATDLGDLSRALPVVFAIGHPKF